MLKGDSFSLVTAIVNAAEGTLQSRFISQTVYHFVLKKASNWGSSPCAILDCLSCPHAMISSASNANVDSVMVGRPLARLCRCCMAAMSWIFCGKFKPCHGGKLLKSQLDYVSCLRKPLPSHPAFRAKDQLTKRKTITTQAASRLSVRPRSRTQRPLITQPAEYTPSSI